MREAPGLFSQARGRSEAGRIQFIRPGRALDDPAMRAAPKLPAILAATLAIRQVRHSEIDPALLEPLPEGARVASPVAHYALGLHGQAPALR